MKYEIVDRTQTMKDYLDGKIRREDVFVVALEPGEVWDLEDLQLNDKYDDELLVIRKVNRTSLATHRRKEHK